MSKRWIPALILIATAPAAASAQFTTFIAPPNPVKDSIQAAVVAEQKATVDSVTKAQIANMKTWVDSAAGIPAAATDTSLRATIASGTGLTTASANGVIAPATASPLPLLMAAGFMLLFYGFRMVRRPKPQPRRIDDR